MKLSTVLASSILVASSISASSKPLTIKGAKVVKPTECIERLNVAQKNVNHIEFADCVNACIAENDETNLKDLIEAINKHHKVLLPKLKTRELRALLDIKNGRIALNTIICKIDQKMIENAMRNDYKELVEKMLKTNATGVQDYTWVPLAYFKKLENVQVLFAHFTKTCKTASDVQTFFTLLSPKQFVQIQKHTSFHKGELTAASLNAIANMRPSEHQKALLESISHIDSDFMANLYARDPKNPVALHKKVAMKLPEDYLKTLNYIPHPEDAQYYTEKQAAKAGKLIENIDLSKAKKSVIQALKNPKAIQRVAENDKVRPKITVEQWNALSEKSKNCKHMVIEKIENLHLLKVPAKCFPELPSETQSYLLVTHPNFEDNILSHMTKAQIEDLKHPKKSNVAGIAILDYIASENKDEIAANIGADEDIDEKDQPCYGLTLEEVNEVKVLSKNISRTSVNLLRTENLDEEDVAQYAHILAKHDEVFDLVNNIDGDLKEKQLAKDSIWVTMKPETFGKLASIDLAKNMTPKVFALIPAANRAKASGAFFSNLPFLKDLNKEKYATLPETAFDAITKANIASVRVADMTNAQLANLSVAVKETSESAFSVITPADFASMNKDRLAVIKAKQWASVTPASFKATFTTPETLAAIPASSTASWTAAQLKDVPTSSLAGVTSEQVEVMGSEVVDAKASALNFLIANKPFLNEAAQIALVKRSPEILVSSASMATVSSAVIAAVALLALF